MSWSARQSSPNIFAWKWPTWGLTASFRADGVGGVGVGGVEGLEEDRDDSDENSPSFLLVLTAAGGAYKREDGVYVAPVNLLKP